MVGFCWQGKLEAEPENIIGEKTREEHYIGANKGGREGNEIP